MKKKPKTKDANPDPKTSKEELSDSDLNKVTGGGRESSGPSISEISAWKRLDKDTP
jgi:bacteriocin-like protein